MHWIVQINVGIMNKPLGHTQASIKNKTLFSTWSCAGFKKASAAKVAGLVEFGALCKNHVYFGVSDSDVPHLFDVSYAHHICKETLIFFLLLGRNSNTQSLSLRKSNLIWAKFGPEQLLGL